MSIGKTTIHKGTQAECSVCNPQPTKEHRERRVKTKTTVDGHLRRCVAQDIGDDEVTKDFRFQLMEKYGVSAPRIDRRVTKPNWMEDSIWSNKRVQWFTITKGLVSAKQESKPQNKQHRPWKQARPAFQRNFNQTARESRPS